jgi:hypothetical protein
MKHISCLFFYALASRRSTHSFPVDFSTHHNSISAKKQEKRDTIPEVEILVVLSIKRISTL